MLSDEQKRQQRGPISMDAIEERARKKAEADRKAAALQEQLAHLFAKEEWRVVREQLRERETGHLRTLASPLTSRETDLLTKGALAELRFLLGLDPVKKS